MEGTHGEKLSDNSPVESWDEPATSKVQSHQESYHILIISINYDSQSKATLLKYRYAQRERKTFQVKSTFTHSRHATNLAVHPLAVSHIF